MSKQISITINRQFGSGGRVVGAELARRLDIEYLDRKILAGSAKAMGLSEEHLEQFDEKAPSAWKAPMVDMGVYPNMGIPYYFYTFTNDELYIAQSKLIEKQAKEESCVIVGRCANDILKDYPGNISVYLYADMEFRCRQIKEVYKMSAKNLEKEVKKIDKERAKYYNHYTTQEWDDLSQYHIAINTGKVGIEDTIDIIEKYVRKQMLCD
ncbi:MAG: AAA family ATPase [Cellulosilyticaceae bacterium]